jgi:hypothetical protein
MMQMTRSRTLTLALVASLALSGNAFAECSLPPAPSKVPDGSTAAEAEMIAAMQTLKRYDADVTTYLKCLEFEARQNRVSKEEQSRKHNTALEQLQSIAAKFNEQVRVFKAKSG